MNGLQALYVNPGWLKCISGINVSHANKVLYFATKILPMDKLLRIGTFIPVILLINTLAFCSLRNFNFLL